MQEINEEAKAYYGLPLEVKYCKKCVVSNQRPSSTVEFKSPLIQKKETITFGVDGICDACRFAEYKNTKIDWKRREKDLIELCDRYRRADGRFDCIVPSSGGKDSSFAAHILKFKYGMHPLMVTWGTPNRDGRICRVSFIPGWTISSPFQTDGFTVI